ncbi:MAG TPA: hypothetical protein VKV05_12005 [Terriglobales bacterium]|nr:hypothetical protein [Terriglobales bacterium]
MAGLGSMMLARQAGAQATTSPATPVVQHSATAKVQASKARTHQAHHKKAAPVADAAPAPPPPPPTLEQSPPTPPQVSFQNGELTIDAPNSTLSQVLNAVGARTGASIDIPPGEGNERVVTKLGPGPPSDVLNGLLNGSKFDYLILGVAGDPGAVKKVILTVRQSGPATTAQNNSSEPAPEAQPEEPDPAENIYRNQPPAPLGGFRRPGIPGGQMVGPGSYQNGQQPPGAKTPQQMMQELQQMQQQQQQYEQQLNPANRSPQYQQWNSANTPQPQD